MKEGWEYKKLGDVCSFMSGYTPQKEELNNKSGVPYFKVSDMNRDENGYEMNRTELFVKRPKKIFPVGAIIFPKNGGAIFTEKKRFLVCDSIIDLNTEAILANESFLKKEYLFYLLTKIKISTFDNGGGLPSVNIKKMCDYEICIPPLPEQQSIVDYLDSAFAKIDTMKANAEKALNEAKALFQASLKEMLEPKEGWEEKKLMDIGELKNGINFNKNESGYNVHILGVGDFGKLFLIDDTDCLQTISLNSNPSEEYILKNEDIVFVRSNGNKNLVGRCVLIHVGEEPCSFSGFCIRFRKSTNEVDACYLTHFLKTENARKKLVGNGANISNLNQKVLNEFVVSYPSISEQQSIVNTLDSLKSKVDRLKANYNKISLECDVLKQAILRQVFE